ncbi:type II secretion system protein M [Thalassotalea sp. LPB0316]|uniref:type II secretion system protein GspM n=1 Tax=Thalassotalea sp. LPB0316 TaxID=2769490 RepID=UPI001868FBD5|nr:type II secretion system protein M [Thalassotalea sp. LPB0316]QOL26596.1 type II secretion system protein M [Thalassotalea sp. LPB0316]
MKEKWQALQPREQQLVALMTIVMAIFLFVTLIWQPLHNNLAQSQQKLSRQQELLVWLQDKTALYQQSIGQSSNRPSTGSLSSITNRSAAKFQITITRIQPTGDDLQVWIDEVSFDSLMDWLATLSASEGIRVKGIDLANSDTSGVVKVRRLQLGKR